MDEQAEEALRAALDRMDDELPELESAGWSWAELEAYKARAVLEALEGYE